MATLTTPRKTRLTDDQRAERRERERERMEAAVEELRSSDGWQTWLRTRSRFHRYSFGNQLLIALQNDEARHVAGFRKWLDLGYAVRKGETALYIWAPCPPSKKRVQEAKERDEDPPRTFFKMVPVFGDNQIEELPPPAQPAPLSPPIREADGDDLANAWQPLVGLAQEIGSEVSILDTGSAGGFYEPQTKGIAVSESASVNQRIKVLVHELAHALVRADRQDDDQDLTYAEEELVAESVAFSVTGTLGLDTTDYSIPYLATWAEATDITILESYAKLTNRLATRIEDAVSDELLA